MMPMMRTNSWIPSVFNDLFDTDFMPKANCTAPAINVKESDKAYTVELAAPGMKKEDFNVHINDEGNLVVKLEQKQGTPAICAVSSATRSTSRPSFCRTM